MVACCRSRPIASTSKVWLAAACAAPSPVSASSALGEPTSSKLASGTPPLYVAMSGMTAP